MGTVTPNKWQQQFSLHGHPPHRYLKEKEPMRRNEKEIKDPAALRAIIQQSKVCRVGLSDGNRPYIVPLCFGYEEGFYISMRPTKGKK
jgi:hypothetical protein